MLAYFMKSTSIKCIDGNLCLRFFPFSGGAGKCSLEDISLFCVSFYCPKPFIVSIEMCYARISFWQESNVVPLNAPSLIQMSLTLEQPWRGDEYEYMNLHIGGK